MDLLEHCTVTKSECGQRESRQAATRHTLVDVGRVGLLAALGALLLLARGGGGGLLASLLLLSGSLSASRGLAAGAGLLLSSFGRNCC